MAAARLGVDGTGGEFLAASRRAADQHPAVGRSHTLDRTAKLVDNGRNANDLLIADMALAQFGVLAAQPVGLEPLGDGKQ